MEIQRWLAGLVLVLVATTSFALGWASRGSDNGTARTTAEEVASAPAVPRASSTTTSRVSTQPTAEDDDSGGDGGADDRGDGSGPTVTTTLADGSAFSHQLTVHTDGCGVIRTEADPEPANLTWEVLDEDGFSVLGRNALGETRYRYFRSGTYSVTLTAWGGDSYIPVSNTVTITC
jgi:hypothetical protein